MATATVHYGPGGQPLCGAESWLAVYTGNPNEVAGCDDCLELVAEDVGDMNFYGGRCLHCKEPITAIGGVAWRRVVGGPAHTAEHRDGSRDQPISWPRRIEVGKLIVTIGIGDQQGTQFEDLAVTVDTGSTFTAVPRALLERLGVPARRSARSRLTDGSSVPVDMGWTVVRLEDQVVATQVTFAEENEPSLLGVVSLEDALLAVDPAGQRLLPVEAERL